MNFKQKKKKKKYFCLFLHFCNKAFKWSTNLLCYRSQNRKAIVQIISEQIEILYLLFFLNISF